MTKSCLLNVDKIDYRPVKTYLVTKPFFWPRLQRTCSDSIRRSPGWKQPWRLPSQNRGTNSIKIPKLKLPYRLKMLGFTFRILKVSQRKTKQNFNILICQSHNVVIKLMNQFLVIWKFLSVGGLTLNFYFVEFLTKMIWTAAN